jgi:hypothetical protein
MIIGILGQMRTGKSSLAREIKEQMGGEFEHGCFIRSFAESLRAECAEIFFGDTNYNRQQWDAVEAADKELCRPILQVIGEGRRRLNGRDYWVNKVACEVGNAPTSYEHLIIMDDVRHENEARWILESGGIIIRLSADRETLIKRGASEERLAHYSETAMIRRSAVEKEYAHRCLAMQTNGLSPAGVFKGLRRFIEELLWGEEE